MGVIKQGILGGFSGSVGSVTGTSWKGIAVIKAKPLSVANPNTAAQQTQRTKFALMVGVAKILLVQMIKPLMDRTAVKQSGYNQFMNLNSGKFNTTGLINAADMVVGRGRVKTGSELAGTVLAANDEINIIWNDNTGDGDALATDVLHGCLYNNTTKEFVVIPATKTRADEALTVDIPAAWTAAQGVHVHASFRRADGSACSDTFHAQSA